MSRVPLQCSSSNAQVYLILLARARSWGMLFAAATLKLVCATLKLHGGGWLCGCRTSRTRRIGVHIKVKEMGKGGSGTGSEGPKHVHTWDFRRESQQIIRLSRLKSQVWTCILIVSSWEQILPRRRRRTRQLPIWPSIWGRFLYLKGSRLHSR